MNKKVQVKIDSMAFKGYGVSRIDGKVVFIPYSVIGDEAWVEMIEDKRSYSMGRLLEILKPSPWRVKPLCQYFWICGGCQWQHIAYSKHGELKKEILKEILKRLGGQKEIPEITMIPSPDSYDYRTRVQLKVKEGALGYYKERSHELVDIERCPIAHPLVNQIILLIRKVLPIFSRLEEVEINVSPEEEKGVLILHLPKRQQKFESFFKEFLNTRSVLKGSAIVSKREATLLGEPQLNFTIPLDLKLRTSPESFFQVNLKQNETLIHKILEISRLNGDERVLDLYAGVGNLTLPLATVSKEVLGIEENPKAVKDARFNAELNGIKNCHFLQGKVEDILEGWKREKPDLVVLDPPRTGCKTVLEQMVGLEPKKIVYVSCDPTTFSRDLRLFSKKGYLPLGLSLIDMFPQTYHMEVVGLLKQS